MRLTVSDPTTWEKPWTVLLPMRPTEGELIEYACHEGNYSMFNLLEVARDEDKANAAKAGRGRVQMKSSCVPWSPWPWPVVRHDGHCCCAPFVLPPSSTPSSRSP